ncbi:MAG TPA: hypothetical protein VGO89_19465 [Streptomyces sp.]|nr:hypothetical protein [Streptomyces sp.]
MTQPPQDGAGGPQYPGPPPQQPPQPPQQPPPAGYGFPQQPPQQPGFGQQPYGYPNPDPNQYPQQPGYGYPPPPPGGPGGSNGKIAAIVAATVAAVLLIAGGAYFVAAGNEDDDVAKPKPSDSATASERTPDPTGEPSEAATDGLPSADPTDFDPDTPGPHSKADGFKGQWQDDDGKTLAIGDKLQSGKGAGKNSVSYIDPGGEGFCIGLGQEQVSGTVFRIAVSCGSGEDRKYIAGNSKQDGDSLTVTWDKGGGSDTLDWNG